VGAVRGRNHHASGFTRTEVDPHPTPIQEVPVLAGFASIFRTPDLRNKVLITLGLLALYRMGCFIPIPGVSYRSVLTCIDVVEGNSLYGLINLFSGGALLQLSVFALGVVPYITASIIIQLLTVVIPRLEALKKEGQSGQAKMTQYTRYLTVGLAVLQCTGIVALARSPGRLFQGCPEQLVPNQSIAVVLSMILTMTAGTVLVMWFGEIITDKGIGNGMSLLIFASILSAFPGQFATIFQTKGAFILGLVLLVALITICAVVYVEQAQRRVPVQYAKQWSATSSTAAHLPTPEGEHGGRHPGHLPPACSTSRS
jgi:preprotein translocase subunit SecY